MAQLEEKSGLSLNASHERTQAKTITITEELLHDLLHSIELKGYYRCRFESTSVDSYGNREVSDNDMYDFNFYKERSQQLLGTAYTTKVCKANPADIITLAASKGYYIDILSDMFKLEDCDLCWVGYVHWFEHGEWVSEDMGCLPNWADMFEETVKYVEMLLNNVDDSLNLSTLARP
jgi:hypothetical protein